MPQLTHSYVKHFVHVATYNNQVIYYCLIYLTDVTIKEVFLNFYDKLVKSLPMKDAVFVAQLVKLLPVDSRHKVGPESHLTSPAEDATFFLNNVISPGIDIEYDEPFTTLLSEMEATDYSTLKHLASEIRKAIQRGKNKMTFFMFCTCRYIQ